MKKTDDWMEKLVKIYRVPNTEESKGPQKMLKESQLKKILNRDNPKNKTL
jgi:hypothetical protein